MAMCDQENLDRAWFTPAFVAAVTDTPIAEIVNMIADGRIVAVKISNGYRIPRKQVLQLLGLPVLPPVFIRNPDAIVE